MPDIFVSKLTAMADFSIYAPRLLQFEGGRSLHPKDKGGPTNRGVTLDTFRRIFGQDKTIDDLWNMTEGEWLVVMDKEHWDACKADKINNQSIAEIIVDWYINSGIAGIRRSQEIAGVKPDGIIGPKSLAAFNSANQKELFDRLWNGRRQFYLNIVKRDPSQREFLDGWMNRLGSFEFSE